LLSIDNEVVANKEGVKTQLHLEVSGSKKQQGALFDSGYQKSPSVPDESPQSLSGNQEAVPLEFKSLNSDNKPTKLSNILSVFDNFDKINELDAVRKERKYFKFRLESSTSRGNEKALPGDRQTPDPWTIARP
jgi:hypothetical protein